MIKQKTGSSKVNLSEATQNVEKSVYRKPMGDESHCKVTWLSIGAHAKDLCTKHHYNESKLLVKVLHKMHSMQGQIDVLTFKIGIKAANSLHE